MFALDPEIVEGAIQDAISELRPSAGAVLATRAALLADLRRVEDEQRRYSDAIAMAGDVAVLAKALQEREPQRLRLQQQIAALDSARRVSTFDVARIEKDLRGKLKDCGRCYTGRRRSPGRCSRS
jgi:hypothetical protein